MNISKWACCLALLPITNVVAGDKVIVQHNFETDEAKVGAYINAYKTTDILFETSTKGSLNIRTETTIPLTETLLTQLRVGYANDLVEGAALAYGTAQLYYFTPLPGVLLFGDTSYGFHIGQGFKGDEVTSIPNVTLADLAESDLLEVRAGMSYIPPALSGLVLTYRYTATFMDDSGSPVAELLPVDKGLEVNKNEYYIGYKVTDNVEPFVLFEQTTAEFLGEKTSQDSLILGAQVTF